MDDEDDNQYSPKVSPRKSIHETSSVQGRKGTPANPRVLRSSVKKVMTKLQFDDEATETTEEIRPEPSGTAATLLKNISSQPVSSGEEEEDSYFSLQSSSSSKDAKSQNSSLNFKLPLGLEGNISASFDSESNTSQDELSTTIEDEINVSSDSVESVGVLSSPDKDHKETFVQKTEKLTKKDYSVERVPSKTEDVEKMSVLENVSMKTESHDKYNNESFVQTIERTILVNEVSLTSNDSLSQKVSKYGDQMSEPKNAEEVKIVVECKGTPTFMKNKKLLKVVDYDLTDESFTEGELSIKDDDYFNEESEAESENNQPILKWTKDENQADKAVLLLETNSENSKGVENCVAKLTYSEEMLMFYSEPKIISKNLPEIKQPVECDIDIFINTVKSNNTSEDIISFHNTPSGSMDQLTHTHIVANDTVSEKLKYSNELNSTPLKKTSSSPKNIIPSAEHFSITRKETNDIEEKPASSIISSMETDVAVIIETQSKKQEITQLLNEKESLSPNSNQTISLDKTPIPQILEEIIRRGKITKRISGNLKMFDQNKRTCELSSSITESENLTNSTHSILSPSSSEDIMLDNSENKIASVNKESTVVEHVNQIENNEISSQQISKTQLLNETFTITSKTEEMNYKTSPVQNKSEDDTVVSTAKDSVGKNELSFSSEMMDSYKVKHNIFDKSASQTEAYKESLKLDIPSESMEKSISKAVIEHQPSEKSAISSKNLMSCNDNKSLSNTNEFELTKTSEITSSGKIPEDEHMERSPFVIKTLGSLAQIVSEDTIFKELEGNVVNDFELKMSEDDSVMDSSVCLGSSQEIDVHEEKEEEMETLKPTTTSMIKEVEYTNFPAQNKNDEDEVTDFELKMSEGDSIMDSSTCLGRSQEVDVHEEEEVVVFETLKLTTTTKIIEEANYATSPAQNKSEDNADVSKLKDSTGKSHYLFDSEMMDSSSLKQNVFDKSVSQTEPVSCKESFDIDIPSEPSTNKSISKVVNEQQPSETSAISDSDLMRHSNESKSLVTTDMFELSKPSTSSKEEVDVHEQKDEEEEAVFETLKPVEFDAQYDESFEQYEDENQGGMEADLYEDLDAEYETRIDKSMKHEDDDDRSESSHSRSEIEDDRDSSVVICLSSSSDERSKPKTSISSTPYQKRTPKSSKYGYTKEDDETLDYEDDGDSSSYQSRDNESIHKTVDNYSEEESDSSKIEPIVYSSESELDTTTHGNRSWRQQRQIRDTVESREEEDFVENEENTIESPPYELIGQDSQSQDSSEINSVKQVNSEKTLGICGESDTKVGVGSSTPSESNTDINAMNVVESEKSIDISEECSINLEAEPSQDDTDINLDKQVTSEKNLHIFEKPDRSVGAEPSLPPSKSEHHISSSSDIKSNLDPKIKTNHTESVGDRENKDKIIIPQQHEPAVQFEKLQKGTNLVLSCSDESIPTHIKTSCKSESSSIENNVSVVYEEGIAQEVDSTNLGKCLVKQSEDVPLIVESKSTTEEIKEDEEIKNAVEQDTDLVKLAENKRRRCLETGSISDLKERRSKRISSANDLSSIKKAKYRRRSSSMHDLTSLIIKETKSVRSQSLEDVALTLSAPSTETNLLSSSEMSKEDEHNICSLIASKDNQLNFLPGIESTATNSKASSVHVEIGSIASNQISLGFDSQVLSSDKLSEYPKRRGKNVTSRLSSLQDISEEPVDNIDNSKTISKSNQTLRRSISTSQLNDLGHIEERLPRRSSSVCRCSDYSNAHESELASEIDANKISMGSLNTTEGDSYKSFNKSQMRWSIEMKAMKTLTGKKPLKDVTAVATGYDSLEIIDSSNEDDTEQITQPTKKHSEGSNSSLNNPTFEISCVDNTSLQRGYGSLANVVNTDDSESLKSTSKTSEQKRCRRAQSEPAKSLRIRTSSSLIKVEDVHKKLFSRHSIKRKSTRESNFEPLEIVQSDEESPEKSDATTSNETEKSEQFAENRTIESHVSSEVDKSQHEENLSSVSPRKTQRGKSEPPSTGELERPEVSSKRRASTSSKLPSIYNLVLPRHSLRKSTLTSNFQPLEIVQSDEEISFSNKESEAETSSSKKGIEDKVTEDDVKDDLIAHVLKKKGRATRLKKNENVELNPLNTQSPELQDLVNPDKNVITLKETDTEKDIPHKRTPKKAGRSKKTQIQQPAQENNEGESSNYTQQAGNKNSENKISEESSTSAIDKTQNPVSKKSKSSKSNKRKDTPIAEEANNADMDQNAVSITNSKKKQSREITSVSYNQIEEPDVKKTKLSKTNRKKPESKDEHPDNKESDKVAIEGTELEEELVKGSSTTGSSPVKVSKTKKGSKTKSKEEIRELITDTSTTNTLTEETKGKKVKAVKTNKRRIKTAEKNLTKRIDNKETKLEEQNVERPELITPLKKRKLKEFATSSEEVLEEKLPLEQKTIQKEEESNIGNEDITSLEPSTTEKANIGSELNIYLDSPARRTRRSLSRASDTDLLLTPVTDGNTRRRTRLSSAMSDIVLTTPTKHGYAESEASDASTSSRINTPSRRSTRRKSLTATPSTPDLVPEDYLVNRRLTRTQHSQLQRSFEASLIGSPRSQRLEDLPEESGENENETTSEKSVELTPVRSSSRNVNKKQPKYTLAKSAKSKHKL